MPPFISRGPPDARGPAVRYRVPRARTARHRTGITGSLGRCLMSQLPHSPNLSGNFWNRSCRSRPSRPTMPTIRRACAATTRRWSPPPSPPSTRCRPRPWRAPCPTARPASQTVRPLVGHILHIRHAATRLPRRILGRRLQADAAIRGRAPRPPDRTRAHRQRDQQRRQQATPRESPLHRIARQATRQHRQHAHDHQRHRRQKAQRQHPACQPPQPGHIPRRIRRQRCQTITSSPQHSIHDKPPESDNDPRRTPPREAATPADTGEHAQSARQHTGMPMHKQIIILGNNLIHKLLLEGRLFIRPAVPL